MMKRTITTLSLALLLTGLCACGVSAAEGSAPSDTAGGDGDAHAYFEGDNIVPHEMVGYCGNTVTTVTASGKEPVSFWGSNSVDITDLLLYLDYSEGTCRCPAEYRVDTEFGEGYEINLTEAFVRHEGKQVSLTEEQTERMREILENPINDMLIYDE